MSYFTNFSRCRKEFAEIRRLVYSIENLVRTLSRAVDHLLKENDYVIANDELAEKLIAFRRQLHALPELAFEEYETTRLLTCELEAAGIEQLDFPLKTGALAQICGHTDGPVIMIRSDIDALPIQEETGLPFSSKTPGKMHACGHDFHMASILGAALLLQARRKQLAGTVQILFQPAEETGQGALRVLESGVLQNLDAVFSMHDMPELPTGTIGINQDEMMAGVDHFVITIEGIGTHAARPEKGIDVIVVASQIALSIQSIVSRNLPPLASAVVSVTRLDAGNTWNVLPRTAQLEGTVRTFDIGVSHAVEARMQALVTHTAEAFGAKATLDYKRTGPAVRNDPQLAAWAESSAARSGLTIVHPDPSFAGEDFANYMQKFRGAFFFMGVSGTADLHHPDMTIDEQAILPASLFFANLAEDMLHNLSKEQPQ